MMNITFLIGSLGGGGAERVVCNLANYLSKNHNVTIVTMVEVKETYKISDKVKHHILLHLNERKNVIYNSYIKYKEMKKYIKEHKEDLYLVMLPWAILLLLHFRNIIKCPIIVSERNDPQSYPKYKQFLLKLRVPLAEGVVFQTKDAEKWYKNFVKNNKTAIIPNAINEDFIGKKYEGERQKVIVGAGRMKAQKNFELLIRSFANIANDFPEYNLKIFGQGNLLDEHQKLAESLGIVDRVEFPGYVTNIGEQIKDASLFVLSSNYEGMPNALMEAMALGLTCVSTNCPCGGPEFLINDGENGLLVNVNDEKMMTDAIKKVLSNEEMAKKLGENASKICKTLAPEKIYGQWEDFILSVINGGNA